MLYIVVDNGNKLSPKRKEIVKLLSHCIDEADERFCFGIGDMLLDVIDMLREDWGIKEN